MAPTTLAATAAAAAALLAGRAAAATTLTLRLLDAGAYPRALCNDGTMSGYWERLSPTGSAIWVVWQSGGGFCYDSASCKKRSVDQRSSRKWTQTVDMDGIFAATDPRLADANLVYVGYCTSDSYFGNATADETPFGYNFLGSEVVAAVFDDLVTNRGLGGDAGTQVLYTGCSAGARGAMFHANAVGATLRARLGDNLARYGVLLDSAFYVDIQPFDASLPSLMSLIQSSAAMTQAASVAMPACAEAYPGDDVWKCFYGQYALPFVTVRAAVGEGGGGQVGRAATLCPHFTLYLTPSALLPLSLPTTAVAGALLCE